MRPKTIPYQLSSAEDQDDLRAERERVGNYQALASGDNRAAWEGMTADLHDYAMATVDPVLRCGRLEMLVYLLEGARGR